MGDRVPKYAILSHTWVEDEEISYQEMTSLASDPDHLAIEKSGYRKILETCRKAKRHDLDYAWVDTCCIDKSSSAELTEAVNSMFKWYQKSEACYAFLADLPSYRDKHPRMPSCRWFFRGWCLQELLAPHNLRFYDATWKYVGSKTELKTLINRITQIDEETLVDSHRLYEAPVAQRMSWASNRITTREEDIAYCLLGIFDVNIPMLYGEGNKAFIRLQEEIIKSSNDLSIFAPEASSRGTSTTAENYCDLFARSPKAFDSCGLVRANGSELVSGDSDQSFTMTNNGLYFREAHFAVTFHKYILSLNCTVVDTAGRGFPLHMVLQKIGPARFVRTAYRRDRSPGSHEYHHTEEAYIITHVKPSTRKLLDASYEGSVWIGCERSHTHDDQRNALRSATPQNRWDFANHRFITAGTESFEGYLMVFPGALGYAVEMRGPQFFYLVCGVTLTKWGKPTAWVRLRSVEDWTRAEQSQGEMASKLANRPMYGSNYTLDMPRLRMNRCMVTATIRPHPDKYAAFNVHLAFAPIADSSIAEAFDVSVQAEGKGKGSGWRVFPRLRYT
ncbi:Uu.00g071020.m01.CDS01 [Anthostomella pinea]|uniref:Uu.00g071020.m01.CDS01 n=1 Tax=Anthostomella pinea TaxID=933095 RepID=A0AAI8YLB3_9PEZI|nr:Uu.00g071020.m01.CDS01 [Anthostomella pinea]